MLARMVAHRFTQVDVFSAVPLLGNALAVIHDADDLSGEQMAAVARWTNLSETTFLCRPTTPEADYRVRIFTTGGELPFAGHPTLGSAHAWLVGGGTPDIPEVVVPAEKIGVLNLMVKAGLAPSTSEARRLIQAGAVKLDEEKVADVRLEIEPKDGVVIRSGKRGFAKIKVG